MNRRHFSSFAAVSAFSGVLISGCHRNAEPPSGKSWMKNPERRPNKDLIAVLSPLRDRSKTLIQTLRSELIADFDVFSFGIERGTTAKTIGELVRAADPKAVVLVDNPTVNTYAKWAQSQLKPPPGFIVMSSFAEELRDQVPNSTGIAFEPPAVRVLADARFVLGVPIHRVGVVYRQGFERYFRRERDRAALEKLQLVGVSVSRSPSAREVHRALMSLRKAEVHALWVPNDNALLSAHLIEEAWMPVLERQRVPVIVGVPSLVSKEIHFGTYAAVPDIEAIGVQTADLIYTVADSGWKASPHAVQPPLSVRTYVDLVRARQLGMTPEGERSVDVLVGGSHVRGGRGE